MKNNWHNSVYEDYESALFFHPVQFFCNEIVDILLCMHNSISKIIWPEILDNHCAYNFFNTVSSKNP